MSDQAQENDHRFGRRTLGQNIAEAHSGHGHETEIEIVVAVQLGHFGMKGIRLQQVYQIHPQPAKNTNGHITGYRAEDDAQVHFFRTEYIPQKGESQKVEEAKRENGVCDLQGGIVGEYGLDPKSDERQKSEGVLMMR